MVHVRREFYDLAKKNTAPIAAEALRRIAALYAIEDTIRGQPPDQRRAARQARSRPLVTDLFTWLEQQLTRLPGGSPTAKAIRYALNHRDGLERFLDDGRAEIGRVGDWRGGARRGGVAVGRRLSPYAGASFPAVRSVSSHRSSNRTCRFPASGFLPTHQAFALDRSTHRLGTSLKPRVDRHAFGLWRNPVLRCPMRYGNQPQEGSGEIAPHQTPPAAFPVGKRLVQP